MSAFGQRGCRTVVDPLLTGAQQTVEQHERAAGTQLAVGQVEAVAAGAAGHGQRIVLRNRTYVVSAGPGRVWPSGRQPWLS